MFNSISGRRSSPNFRPNLPQTVSISPPQDQTDHLFIANYQENTHSIFSTDANSFDPDLQLLSTQFNTQLIMQPSLHKLNQDLLVAAFSGNLFAVREALSQGADPNAQDQNGNTPLHLVMLNCHPKVEMTNMLLSKGACADIKNNQGFSAVDVGEQKKTILLLIHNQLYFQQPSLHR